MSSRKSGGLGANPLLRRTEPATATTALIPPVAEEPSIRPPVDTQTRVRADTPTSKFTFYFTDEQLDRLDHVWEGLRREGRRTGVRLSKSHVVRVALDRLLDEFEEDPERVLAELKQQLAR